MQRHRQLYLMNSPEGSKQVSTGMSLAISLRPLSRVFYCLLLAAYCFLRTAYSLLRVCYYNEPWALVSRLARVTIQ